MLSCDGVNGMFEMKCRKYTEEERRELAALFADTLCRSESFCRAFPEKEAQLAHATDFVEAYHENGEIHTYFEDGRFRAAALWSLPGQQVPSPVWDMALPEPCCKLYLLVSQEPGAGNALLHFARFRYEKQPLYVLCAEAWQKDYFTALSFKEMGENAFGTMLCLECEIPSACGGHC